MKDVEKEIICVAIGIADDGKSSFLFENKCSFEDLENLKKEHEIGIIILTGWLPIEFYNGTVSENDLNFIFYES